MYDVTIIGGGIIGCLTARALLRRSRSVCILEKHAQAGYETSKANSAIIHAGYDCPVGSKKARFNVEGNEMMPGLCEELDVEYRRTGSLVIAFSPEEENILEEIKQRGVENGVCDLSIITGEEARVMEPALSPDVTAALYAQTAGIVSSYKLARRACQNAVANGAELLTNHEVTAIKRRDGVFTIQTTGGDIQAGIIINAAGVFADEISRMAGDESFTIMPRRGEYVLYDKKLGGTVNSVIFQTPTQFGKGILIAPTVGGPLLIGPNAHNTDDKYDTDTTSDGLVEVFNGARKSVPSISNRDIIASFAGLRAVADTDDFIIGPSHIAGLIHAAGIQSPGLSAAPAIAEYVAGIVNGLEPDCPVNESFNPVNEPQPHILNITAEELHALIEKNPAYGNIICRCETVTEAEIISAIRAGANDIDSIKQETRAGMGRCQGGFCMPKVLELVARETGIPFTEVTKSGSGSYILTTPIKEATV